MNLRIMPKPAGNERSASRSELQIRRHSTLLTMPSMLQSLVTALFVFLSQHVAAGPKAELWEFWTAHQAQATTRIDHSPWNAFLQRNLVATGEPTRLRYAEVSQTDKVLLDDYLDTLQGTAIDQYNRAEQLAYWINFYNAATVQLILDHWPVKSITKIKPHLFAFGPWDMKLWTVRGQELSLNDIEHRILRPIWPDPRLHYAVNCASLGCPSLAAQAYTAEQLEEMLNAGAARYVNAPRGVTVTGKRLKLSTIYKWFQEDFGGSEDQVIAHLRQYANPALKEQLGKVQKVADYAYDWTINASP